MTTKAPKLPEAPAHLSDRAKELWRQTVARAQSPERQILLQTALESLDRADQAAAVVAVEGLVVKSERSHFSHAHPLLKVEEDSRARFMKCWTKLGFGTGTTGIRFIQTTG